MLMTQRCPPVSVLWVTLHANTPRLHTMMVGWRVKTVLWNITQRCRRGCGPVDRDMDIPAPEKHAKMEAVARKAVRTMAGCRPRAMSTSGPTTNPLQKAAPASRPYLHGHDHVVCLCQGLHCLWTLCTWVASPRAFRPRSLPEIEPILECQVMQK